MCVYIYSIIIYDDEKISENKSESENKKSQKLNNYKQKLRNWNLGWK